MNKNKTLLRELEADTNAANSPAPGHNYKDTLFRMIFKEKKELLSLYNAVHGRNYTNPDDLEIVTLENAIYMSMKNDLACIIDCHLSLYEHQSTVNPNMPLRDFFYVAREYEKLLSGKTLYSSTLIKIPAPTFVTFYNGKGKQPERVEMKLSDAFEMPMDNPALELRVIQLNVNTGHNEALMEKCPTLKEYSLYVARVRKYKETVPLREAGREEGLEAGADTFATLTGKLLKDRRTDDLLKATTDKVFRDKLYQEYGIIPEIHGLQIKCPLRGRLISCAHGIINN